MRDVPRPRREEVLVLLDSTSSLCTGDVCRLLRTGGLILYLSGNIAPQSSAVFQGMVSPVELTNGCAKPPWKPSVHVSKKKTH